MPVRIRIEHLARRKRKKNNAGAGLKVGRDRTESPVVDGLHAQLGKVQLGDAGGSGRPMCFASKEARLYLGQFVSWEDYGPGRNDEGQRAELQKCCQSTQQDSIEMHKQTIYFDTKRASPTVVPEDKCMFPLQRVLAYPYLGDLMLQAHY